MNLLLRACVVVVMLSNFSMASEEEGAQPHYTKVNFSTVYEEKHGELTDKIYLNDLEKKFPLEQVDWTGFNIVDFIEVCATQRESQRESGKVKPVNLYKDLFIHILIELAIFPRLISTDAPSITSVFMSKISGDPRGLLNKMGYVPKVNHSRSGATYTYTS